MTESTFIRIRPADGGEIVYRTNKPWTEVFDTLAIRMYPNGPHIGGPALHKEKE